MSKTYTGRNLDHIAYPMGGLGAGMICIEGTGSFGEVSIRNYPNVYWEPNMFAALTILGETNVSRVVEGPVPLKKIYGGAVHGFEGAGNGMTNKNYGLPRFRKCSFSARFPFAHISLSDHAVPLSVEIEGFSPFIPSDADNSSLPAAAVSYTFKNDTDEDIDAVFYFSAMQFMAFFGEDTLFTKPLKNGFMFAQENYDEHKYKAGAFAVTLDCDAASNTDFYRGGWWDSFTMRWNSIADGSVSNKQAQDNHSPGGAAETKFKVRSHSSHKITVRMTWYVPDTDVRCGDTLQGQEITYHRPWYAGKYSSAVDVMNDFTARFTQLYSETKKFSDALYETDLNDKNTTDEVLDAVASNLVILKSPTVLRQEDGRFWAWEGCADTFGSCHGTCTHVWNYAQAPCHLFPEMERSFRETEFNEDMDEQGHQQFRSSLPIRENSHNFHAASDGQPGGIMKMYREYRISGDREWIESYYDRMVRSMEYCIRTWDKKEEGILREPHHNTYDIEFWGADGMCTSFYLGALKAMSMLASELNRDGSRYAELYQKGREYMETILWNGEYFIQDTQWKGLEAEFNTCNDPLLETEGPKYQYGKGCISDGVCGAWLAKECGLGDILDPEKTKSHLLSVYKYNFRRDLSDHANPQRPGYAVGNEGGLLLCSWPYGGKPSIPFVYSDEVWTGIEYQVAAHLASFGYKQEALDIIKTLRDRYDGEKRNPYDEYECGHWYARALASYALLADFTGVRYDAPTKTLSANRGNYKVFLATAEGYGVVTAKEDNITLDVKKGNIPLEKILIN